MPDDPSLLPQLLVLILLILVNAFFAAAEIAVISLSETKLKKQAEEGDKKARKLLALTQAPDHLRDSNRHHPGRLPVLRLCRRQLFRSPCELAGGPGRDPNSRRHPQHPHGHCHHHCPVLLQLGAGRAGPQAHRHEKDGGRPIIWLLSKSTNGVLRLLHIDPKADEEEVSEDEIRMMVDLGEERGTIETAEKELIENIFEFNNSTAEDVMIHRTDMVMVRSSDTPEEILNTIRQSGLSRFPVYEEDADDIVGILSTRVYLLNTQQAHPKPLRELLYPAYFVPESVRTDVLFRDMQSKKVHLAIVVDEYGGTSGLVTMEDLLEEIVGNIYDEFDPQEEAELVQLEENLWQVSGSCDLEQLSQALGITFPEDQEFDTLGGLVFAQLSVIPSDGEELELDAYGLHIKVLNFTDRRVERALVSKLPTQPEESSGH